ncbi:unnamed protein product [Dicrocoelium dendriticum]|nr:unnamed protein product [Dicrocoelium dendriticum]
MELNHFMSFESVLSAARRYLHPETGRIFPRHYRMHLLGIHSGKSLRHTHCDVWTDYKMSALHRASLCKVHLMDVSAALGSDATDSCHILTSTPCVLYDLDLLQLTRSKSDHSTAFPSLREYPFSFTVGTSSESQASVVLDAVVAYFDVRFDDDAPTPSSFSTSPSSAQTHWKHAVLFLNTPIQVEHGDLVTGTVSIHRRADPKCSLDLQLCVNALRDQPALRQRYSFECAFREPQFDSKRWINEALKSATVEHNVQEKATDLVLQLQGQLKEVMQTLDRTRQDIMITVPRVLREVEALKSDALTLGSELEQLKASLSEVNAGGQQTITRLVELDRERRNAQAAANALQETVRWSNLVNGIDELLEAGELDQVCCSLEGMEQCLTALNLLSDYSERMTLLERHKNSLEALIAPQIIHALDHTTADAWSRLDDTEHVDREAKHLINLLHRIGREAAAKNYYTNWLKLQLKSYWEKSSQPQQASIGPAPHRFVEKMLAFGPSEPPDHTFLSGDASSQCTQSLSPILLTFYACMIQLFEHQVQCHLFGASHPMVLMKAFTDALESLHSTRTTFVLGSTVDSADLGGTHRAEQLSSLLKISLRCCSLLGDILSSQFPNMDAPAYRDVCGQLVHAILSPFGAIVDTFGRQLRKRFEDELSRIQLNTAEQHHFLDGLAQTISSSIQLIHTSIQSCFDLTLGMGLPHLFSSIQFYWVTLLAKWTIAIERSGEHLINTDAKGGHSQTTGFVCALRVATLTGELSLKADAFVENLMDKSADFLSKVFTPSDSSPLLGIGIFSTSLYTEDWNSICSSDWALLNQLALSLPSDCLDALQSIAHPSDRIEQLDGSTIPRLQTSLSSLHRTNVTACRAAVLMLRRVALAPIRQFLQPVPSLPVWSTKPDSGDDTLPDLAYLPQDYITRVGQYLLVLFDHLEPYMCNGNDPELSAPRDSSDFTPSQALTECLHLGNLEAASIPARVASTGHSEAEAHTSNLRRRLVSLTHDSRRCTEIDGGLPVFRWFESFVSGTACDLLATNMLRIGDAAVARTESRLSRGQRGDDTEDESELRRHELLTSHGAKQLEVDLGYLQHLLDDLGLSFPGHLQALRELISCPADRFASVSASRPPSIVNAIARIRGL